MHVVLFISFVPWRKHAPVKRPHNFEHHLQPASWTLSKAQQKPLDVNSTKVFRRIVGVRWYDYIPITVRVIFFYACSGQRPFSINQFDGFANCSSVPSGTYVVYNAAPKPSTFWPPSHHHDAVLENHSAWLAKSPNMPICSCVTPG